MSEISAVKAEFAQELIDAGLRVSDFVPERITPPIVILNAASPYIQTSQFGEYTLGLEIVIVASMATNKKATQNLDDAIEEVLKAIEPLTYVRLINVNQPYNLQTNNAEYLATNVYVQLSITI
jgi:hypothetical protein